MYQVLALVPRLSALVAAIRTRVGQILLILLAAKAFGRFASVFLKRVVFTKERINQICGGIFALLALSCVGPQLLAVL
ncbi:hypothetical protein [Sutterella sp.]|uniref:hypothetical protein n=1 Tax=Sutterella sp. TaxID=1981025 RepID=UPI0026E046CC|nr:hypothetical protein [Sutterella sp.]MDO5532363.1 hypothetical protein [Sutterella sp.]